MDGGRDEVMNEEGDVSLIGRDEGGVTQAPRPLKGRVGRWMGRESSSPPSPPW